MQSVQRDCPVCGQESAKVLFRAKASPGPICQCKKCHMVYVKTVEDPRALIFDGPSGYGPGESHFLTSSNLEDVQSLWDVQDAPDKEAEFPNIRMNAIQALQKIENFTGKPDGRHRILDFGSGYGFFLSVAKERGWQAYGLEPLVGSSVYARARFGLTIKTDILREDTFPPDFFDVVTAFQVFEHIPSPADSLNYLSTSMKRGGVIMIEVPRFDTWTVRILGSRHRHFVPDHVNFFSYETLSLLLKQHGIQILDAFQPIRFMSVRHLFSHWLSKLRPKFMSEASISLLRNGGLWHKTLKLKVGDNLAILGRKL